MLIISHRGNLYGPNPVTENNPHQIMSAIYRGFDVEIDIWYTPEGLFLGHDEPKYKIDYHFLVNKHLWVHCKNIESFIYHYPDREINVFFHKDDVALTSSGHIITAPGMLLSAKSIAAMPEMSVGWNTDIAYGICTDYPFKYRAKYEKHT